MTDLRQIILREAPPENSDLVQAIRDVCTQLTLAENRFTMESDNDLIEAAIYETVALHARYRYLLRLAKEQGVSVPAPRVHRGA